MRFIPLRFLPILVLSGLLTSAQAATVVAAQPPANPPITYPQIVRLSYVEGDVRISRGKEGEKADEQESGETTGWEQAVAGLPIETGYSLVTGKGRAEIEFEDVSTVYLADNSVLSFNDLSATGGVPLTVMSLLSGTASLNAADHGIGRMVHYEYAHRQHLAAIPAEGFCAGEQLSRLDCDHSAEEHELP